MTPDCDNNHYILRLRFLNFSSENSLTCKSASGENIKIALEGKIPGENEICSHMHIKDMLAPGCRINAIGCTELPDGSLLPSLIVYNPDYLVDITSVAGCFESYGNTPLASLVKRLKPDPRSQAILLGNFASELLDECVRRDKDVPADYPAAVKEFFRSSALNIAATDDFNSPEFHNQAIRQQKNIENAVRNLIPKNASGAEPDRMILEPTFFCEALGLQGRMDLISEDFSLVVEQKSGKGGFGSDNRHPVPQLPHQIQLTLYRAIFMYGRMNPPSHINSFLLYSRYDNPLLRPLFSPKLLRKAIEMRNSMVFQEEILASENGYDILDSLTPEVLNVANACDKLWKQYTRPQLQKLIDTYHSASEMEQTYVKRMLEFVSREHLEAKCGYNEALRKGGFASAWNSSIEERICQGCIYTSLIIKDLTLSHNGKVKDVVLNIPPSQLTDAANFRTGDIVALYSYPEGSIPDIRYGIVIRATISGFGASDITLRLRAQQPKMLFEGQKKLWAIEPDFYESSFRPIYRNIYNLLSAPYERRRMILYPAEKIKKRGYRLKGNYGEFNDLVLRALDCDGIFAVIGPPGTGKTSFGLMNILKEELANPDAGVLLTAYTNRAVDEICSRLVSENIPFIRLGTGNGTDPAFTPWLIGEKLRGCGNIDSLRNTLCSNRVFVGTTHALSGNCPLLKIRKFSLAIVDEASQILEPQILGLLAATGRDSAPAVGRFILIGDHRQLPAVVMQTPEQSAVQSGLLNEIRLTDCRQSYFERFLNSARLPDGTLNPDLAYSLTHYGRMHREVAEFASRMFYGDSLEPVPLPHQNEAIPQKKVFNTAIGNILNRSRNIFINMENDSCIGNVSLAEAKAAADVAVEIYLREADKFDISGTLGIIVPYRMQGAAIRSLLCRTGLPDIDKITIDTVERFQGGQREYIIYTTVACNEVQLGFLTANRFTDSDGSTIDRKLNVALTRARSHNIVIGNGDLLSGDLIYAKLTDFFTRTCITPDNSNQRI